MLLVSYLRSDTVPTPLAAVDIVHSFRQDYASLCCEMHLSYNLEVLGLLEDFLQIYSEYTPVSIELEQWTFLKAKQSNSEQEIRLWANTKRSSHFFDASDFQLSPKFRVLKLKWVTRTGPETSGKDFQIFGIIWTVP